MDDFRIGRWLVEPASCRVSIDGRSLHVRSKVMELLQYLAAHPLEVVSKDRLLDDVWGTAVLSESALTRTMTELRQALGDDVGAPRFIETIPKRGYRLIAPITPVATMSRAPAAIDRRFPPLSESTSNLVRPSPHADVGSTLTLELSGNPSAATSPLSVRGWLLHHRVRTILIACALIGSLGAALFVKARTSAAGNWRSIAVLPFRTVGNGDADLADALTEALTSELGKIPGLQVIASNTAFTYRDTPTLRTVARELNVGLVVTGSVQRNHDSMSVTASVVDTRRGTTLWSEHFSGRVSDALAVQNDISGQLALAVARKVGASPPATSRAATRHAQAYQAYLRGLWHLKGRSSSMPNVSARMHMRHAAVQELERAVMLDPEFALARATLASAYTQLDFYDAPDRRFNEKAFGEVERALRIDPRLPEAYLARAQVTWTSLNRFPHEAAIMDLRRAVALNANLADAHMELEKVYYHMGLTDKALAAGEQVQRLDPLQAWSTSRGFRALIDAGRLEQVRVVVDGNANLGSYARADALIALGRTHDALQHLSSSSATKRGAADYDIGAVALLGLLYAKLDQPKNAEHVLAMIIPAAENPTGLSHMHHAQLHIGATFSLLGRKDDAVRWLTKAADEGYPSFPRFSTDLSLTSLKGHPPYEALLRRLKTDWDRWNRSL
jgi:TolB-like protein/DNA-binding winged helix-turn-helix (wHTH) protein